MPKRSNRSDNDYGYSPSRSGDKDIRDTTHGEKTNKANKKAMQGKKLDKEKMPKGSLKDTFGY